MSTDDEKPPLDAALRHLAEQQRRSLTSHPTPQELAAYHAGELPAEAEARILDHLAICRECSDLLLDLSGFADLKPPEGVPDLTDQQVEQDWQSLRAKMRKEAPERKPAEVVPIRPVEPPARPVRWSSPLLPVAASLLAVLGFSFAIYQSVQVRKLSQPRLVRLVDPGFAVRGDSAQRFSAREGGVIHLIPDPDAGEGHTSYAAEISRKGETVASLPVETIEQEDLFVLIPPGFLEPGEYEAYLYGIKGGEKERLSDVVEFEAK